MLLQLSSDLLLLLLLLFRVNDSDYCCSLSVHLQFATTNSRIIQKIRQHSLPSLCQANSSFFAATTTEAKDYEKGLAQALKTSEESPTANG